MSRRKDNLVNGGIYHVYNRGVDKRNIFMDDEDHIRFIHDLFEFNDKNPTIKLNHYLHNNSEVGLPNIFRKNNRKILVDILAFCMMDNHYHLILHQKSENGVTKFMRKLGTGYTNYFNKKYDRTGSLFQGQFKSVCVKKDSHLMYLPIYIHFNPLDFNFPEWRDKKIKNLKEAMTFLDSYRWSSYMDYTGQKNFPSVINKNFLISRLGNEKKIKEETINWLKNFNPIDIIRFDL